MQTSILFKTLAFKLEVVAEALVDMLSFTPADSEDTTLKDTQCGVYTEELMHILTDKLAEASG